MDNKLPSGVFDFDPRIRYCGILDQMGRTIAGGMKPGVESLEPQEAAETVDLQVALVGGMAQSGLQYLGKTNFIIIHREKLMLIAIPRAEGKTVLISTEPDFSMGKVKALFELVNKSPI